jgi:hypothetical protein
MAAEERAYQGPKQATVDDYERPTTRSMARELVRAAQEYQQRIDQQLAGDESFEF